MGLADKNSKQIDDMGRQVANDNLTIALQTSSSPEELASMISIVNRAAITTMALCVYNIVKQHGRSREEVENALLDEILEEVDFTFRNEGDLSLKKHAEDSSC